MKTFFNYTPTTGGAMTRQAEAPTLHTPDGPDQAGNGLAAESEGATVHNNVDTAELPELAQPQTNLTLVDSGIHGRAMHLRKLVAVKLRGNLDAKEHVGLIVDLVETALADDDLQTALTDLKMATDLPEGALVAALEYVRWGDPPAREAMAALLSAACPDVTSPGWSPSKPPALAGDTHSDSPSSVALVLYAYAPLWWVDLEANRYGRMLIKLPSFSSSVTSAPLDHTGVRAQPLMDSIRMGKDLTVVNKNRAQWPVKRCSIFHELARILGFHFSLVKSTGGVTDELAFLAAEREVLRVIQSGIQPLSALTADAINSLRCEEDKLPGQCSLELLRAVDLHFAPRDSASYLAWSGAVPTAGDTAYDYYGRLVELASIYGMDVDAVNERFKSALYVCASQQASPYSDRASSVSAHFVEKIIPLSNITMARTVMNNHPLYTLQPIVPPSKQHTNEKPLSLPTNPGAGGAGGAGGVGGGGATPGPRIDDQGRQVRFDKDGNEFFAKQAWNLVPLWEAAKRAGFDMGDLPDPSPTKCRVCMGLGFELIKWTDGSSIPPGERGKKAHEHGTWRCLRVPEFATVVATKLGESKDGLCVKIDNPGAVYRANAGKH
jgi:hypothetical protein